jgi:uncharacterized protein YpuA (DUF1002 family)
MMPNSFRKRLKKVLLESDLSSDEVKRVLDAMDEQKSTVRKEVKSDEQNQKYSYTSWDNLFRRK